MPSLGNLFFKIGADVSEATKGIKEVKSQLESIKKITGFTAILQGANAAIGVFNSVVSAVRPLVEEFDKAAKSAAKLQVAIGGNVAEARDLVDQANNLQRTRLFSADQTVNAQATLAALGLTKTTIKELIPLVQDFASATGQDLSSAAQAVGRAVVTGSDSLKKYGISIGDAKTQSQRFENVVNGLTKAFGGQAEAVAKVGAGPLQLMVQRFSQIKEVAGEALVKFANELLPAANDGIDQLAATMQNLPVYAENLGKAFSTAFKAIGGIYDTFIAIDNIAGRPLQKLQAIIQALFGIEKQQEKVKNRGDIIQPGFATQQAGVNRSGFGPEIITKKKGELKEIASLTDILTEAQGKLMESTVELDNSSEAYADALNDLRNIQQQLYDLEQKRLAVIGEISQKQFDTAKIPTRFTDLLPERTKELRSTTDQGGIASKIPGLDEQNEQVLDFKNTLSEVQNIFVGIGQAGAEAFGQIAASLLTGQLAFADLGKAALQAARQIVQAALAEAIAALIASAIKKFGLLGVGIAIAGVALISSLFKSKVPKLAKGGLAYGPQLAVVGDNPNARVDPEVISPLSKLHDMIKGEMYQVAALMAGAMDAALRTASVTVPGAVNQDIEFREPQELVITGKIEGNDLRLLYDRSASTQSKFQPRYY